jgi:N-methylhydantoinase A
VFRGVGEVQLPIYERSLAPIGVGISGPCIIEQYDATLVVEPGWRAVLDEAGQIILTHQHQEA